MLNMPKKSFFEKEQDFLKRVTQAFEKEARLDPLNAHYAAKFFVKSKALGLGDFKKEPGPSLIVAACKKIIAEAGDITSLSNIKDVIDDLKAKN